MSKINFLVLSRAQATNEHIQSTIKVPHILISINDVEDGIAEIPDNENRKGRLSLTFSDITDRNYEGGIFFNSLMADDILKFVDKYIQDINLIVVHCLAGRCRSVACASALSKILNNEDDEIFKSGIPNMLVYNKMLNQYFLTTNYHLEWSHIHGFALQNYDEV